MSPALWLWACAAGAPAPIPEPQETPAMDPELARHLASLNNRVPQAEYLDAVPWFRDHTEAEPAVVAELDGGGPGAARAADLLGRLGQPASVPALARALSSPRMAVRSAAGLALGVHPAPAALDALAAAVGGEQVEAVTAALDGLARREGDPGVCAVIRPLLDSPDEAIRHHAAAAARARGC